MPSHRPGGRVRRRGSRIAVVVSLLAVFVLGLPGVARPAITQEAAPAVPAEPTSEARAEEAYGKLPLRFEENRGQSDRSVDFLVRTSGYTAFLTKSEAVFSLAGPEGKASVLRMGLEGANPNPAVEGFERLGGVTNYFSGSDPSRWQTNVPSYARVTYKGVYPGVDLVYRGQDEERALEYDFVVAPGADPGRIALDFQGAKAVSVDDSGDLVVETGAGPLRQPRPVVYQQMDGEKHTVDGAFVVEGNHVRFAIGPYDRTKPLVIDPAVAYSTYLGSDGEDVARGLAVDGGGNAYVTGITSSAGFPGPDGDTASGEFKPSYSIFVAKMEPDGSDLVYSTFLGNGERGFSRNATAQSIGITVDTAGNAFLTGLVHSTQDFPTTAGAYQRGHGGLTQECISGARPFVCTSGDSDAFLLKLSANGSQLLYSTFFGRSAGDYGNAVAVDDRGHAYITGFTFSAGLPSARVHAGGEDAFVAKFNLDPDDPPGEGDPDDLLYFTYFGGSSRDIGRDIDVDASRRVHVAGSTTSTNLPTPGGFRTTPGGAEDGFVAVLNPAVSSPADLAYGTYVGGNRDDYADSIAVDDTTGDAVVTGQAKSTALATQGAFQVQKNSPEGDPTVFLAKVRPGQIGPSSLAWLTYLGPAGQGDEVAVDPSGSVWVSGSGRANGGVPFPTSPDAFPVNGPGAFAARLSGSGDALLYNTFLGPAGDLQQAHLGLDPMGNAYVAATNINGGWPWVEAFQEKFAEGVVDVVVAKISAGSDSRPVIAGITPASSPTTGGIEVVITGRQLSGATTARFGDALSPRVTVESDTRIKAVAPPHAVGEVIVTVTTPGGISRRSHLGRFLYGEGSWAGAGELPERRHGHTATLLPDGRVLVAGGCCSGTDALRTTQIYDPRSGTWTAGDPMNTPRMKHTATLLLGTQEECGTHCGKVLVVGGCINQSPCDSTVNPAATRSAELFDPRANDGKGAWAPTGSLPLYDLEDPAERGRASHTATLLRGPGCGDKCGKVLTTGGLGADPGGNDAAGVADLYDPKADDTEHPGQKGAWTPTEPMVSSRVWHTAALLSADSPTGCGDKCGKVLVVGGRSRNFCQTGCSRETPGPPELYDPAIGSWRVLPDTEVPRISHTATSLPNGKVLIAGGITFDGSSVFNTGEVYDPTTAAEPDPWRRTGLLRHRRYDHAAALLPSGKVLVVGGGNDPSSWSSAEVFDPSVSTPNAVGAWTPAGQMQAARIHPAVTVLSSQPDRFEADPAVCGSNCGKVLVVGGGTSVAELYSPAPPPCPTNPTELPGYVLDGWGGLHATGGAPPAQGGPYWFGWDIARDVVDNPSGPGGYVLDGWGGLHSFNGAPSATSTGYWREWDIARAVALRPGGQGGWVLDGWGGLHPIGNPGPTANAPYWREWDIARDVVANPHGEGGWVLDGWGGLHAFGGAPPLRGTGYWFGWDIARKIVLNPSGQGGWVLDGWGGLHPFGPASEQQLLPPLDNPAYPQIPARDAYMATGGQGQVLSGFGSMAIMPIGCVSPPRWPGWDIARAFAPAG